MGLGNHTAIVLKDNKVAVFGNNSYGQLGDGSKITQAPYGLPTPKILPLVGVKSVSWGYAHTMFLMEDGTVKAVGLNTSGQLGDGGITTRETLIDVPITGVAKVICGFEYTMFLMQDGSVKGVGRNDYGQIGNGVPTIQQTIQTINLQNVKQIACGQLHTIFLMLDGTVKSVGGNDVWQLGIGNQVNQTTIQSLPIQGVKQIASGANHVVCLMSDGTVKAFGLNTKGQLGIGNTINQNSIVTVPISGVKQVATGYNHTIFLMEDGTVRSVGSNDYGQLGTGDTVQQSTIQNVNLTGVSQIDCGLNTSLFLMKDGSMKSVGDNSVGQLGVGDTISPKLTIQTVNISGVKYLSGFSNVIKYLIQDGTSIKAYNNNEWSTLGEAPLTKTYLDQAMTSLTGLTNVSLSQLVASTPELLAWYEEDEGAKTLTMNGPIWEEVSTTLPSPEDMVLKGMPDLKVVPPEAWADLGGDFEVVTYTNDLDETQKLFLDALPKSQLIAGSTDFSEIAQMLLVASTGVKVVASSDAGVTWKALNNGVWQAVNFTTGAVKASGMSVAAFNLITADQWKALGSAVRFAYLLEGDALLDKITVTKVQITDATPSLDSMQVEYEELTLEGRLKDLERLNAINLAKLNFKANALLLSDSYKLDDMVVDTFEKDSIQTTQSNLDEAVEQVFTTPVAMGDGFLSEVVIEQVKTVKAYKII